VGQKFNIILPVFKPWLAVDKVIAKISRFTFLAHPVEDVLRPIYLLASNLSTPALPTSVQSISHHSIMSRSLLCHSETRRKLYLSTSSDFTCSPVASLAVTAYTTGIHYQNLFARRAVRIDTINLKIETGNTH